MKPTLAIALQAGLAVWVSAAGPDPAGHVDPFIGTGGHGHTFPGAALPFGMVQLSPDTYTSGWDWCSGYHWSDNSIMGFSHTHLSGTGCGDLGDILLMPTSGEVKLAPGSREQPEAGYRSRFSHDDEQASPGYYAVTLATPGVRAELTATPRVGVHRYTWQPGRRANVVIDLVHGIHDQAVDLALEIVGDRTVTGMRRSRGWAADQVVHFVAEFSRPFASFGTATGDARPEAGRRSAAGRHVKGWVSFAEGDDRPVVVKVALSTTGVDGARKNLAAEAPGWDFEAVRAAARAAWNEALGRVEVGGAPAPELEVFHTALYHTLLAPTLISDVDGRFRGSDGEVHQAGAADVYSTFSLWDTFRAAHPLYTILEPGRVSRMIQSFQLQARFSKDGTLPIWPLYANETRCMIGYHSFPVIAEAHAKGIRDWDVEGVFQQMLENTRRNDWWADKGYMPADKEGEAVAKTLEFAYDDWALAQLAKALGKEAEHAKFLGRAAAYRNLWDKESGFMRGRLDDGSWRTPFRPTAVNKPGQPHDFTEGNAWQYMWSVQHDVKGLAELCGGREAFIAKLDGLFEHPPVAAEDQVPDVSGLIGQYAHGNEPSHHVAYLYACAGAPWKTQQRVRQIRDTLYTDQPDGLCGNEDCGQMSAWYVFSALGFYPVNPVQATYVIGLPAFRKAALRLPGGKRLVVSAPGLSAERRWVAGVRVNGREHPKVYLTHDELVAGGEVEFVMAAEPDSAWGTREGDLPPSMSD